MSAVLHPPAKRSPAGAVRLGLTALLLGWSATGLADGPIWPGAEPDALQVAFGGDPLQGNWVAERANGTCTLIQSIRGYGEARFTRNGAAAPSFELEPLRPHFNGGAVDLASVTPVWHRAHPQQHLLAAVAADDDGALRLEGSLVQQMLMQLRDGRQLSFRQGHVDAGAIALSVDVSPVHFRPVYGELAGCGSGGGAVASRNGAADAAVDADEEATGETRVFFDIDSSRLLPESLERLEQLVAEVEARLAETPPALLRIRIEGHTDSTGTEAHNEGLSQRRAEAVAAVLREAGIDNGLLELSHHAARRPAAGNDSADDRQRNRRTRVTLVAP